MQYGACSPASAAAAATPYPAAQTTIPVELGAPYHSANEDATITAHDPFTVDPALVERGTRRHATTQNCLAAFLTTRGLTPRSPKPGEPNFDLAWVQGDAIYVAEVKSLTEQNEEKQLRLGLGQVLRYRHLLGRGGKRVRAVLVVERKPSDPSWCQLCEEVGITFTWPQMLSAKL